LDEGYNAVVDVDGLLRLGEVGYMTFIIHATHVESVTDGYTKITTACMEVLNLVFYIMDTCMSHA
jgi:hypothetical protein